MKIRLRHLSALLAMCLLMALVVPVQAADDAAAPAAVYEAVAEENEVQLAEQAGICLYINITTAAIRLFDTATGQVWRSNPPESELPESVTAVMSKKLASQLVVKYLDSDDNEATVNSYTASVSRGTFQLFQIENGVKMVFDFSTENTDFVIPLQLTLDKGYLQATVLYDEIEERGEARISEIDVLPYLCMGADTDEGYLFIPDGSGALIDFKDNIRNTEEYRKRVYGDDLSVNLLLKDKAADQGIHLPVFGVKKNAGALLAVIAAGDANSSVYAFSNAKQSPYSNVGCSFIYHQNDLTGIRTKESNTRTFAVYSEATPSVDPVVRYYVLRDKDANYSGMARTYRQYLKDNNTLSGKATAMRAFTLDFYGSTTVSASVFGISFDKLLVTTTMADVQDLYQSLADQGTDAVDLVLYGFEKGGYHRRYQTKATIDRRVGGQKGLTALLSAAKKANVYLAYNPMQDYDERFSLFKQNRYVKALNDVVVSRKPSLLSTGDWDYDKGSYKYVKTNRVANTIKGLAASAQAYKDVGVLYEYVGRQLYSDFTDKAYTDRQTMADTLAAAVGKTKVSSAADGANAYLLGKASLLTNVPTTAGNNRIISRSVPSATNIGLRWSKARRSMSPSPWTAR